MIYCMPLLSSKCIVYTIYNPELKFALFDMKLLPFCLFILVKLLKKGEGPHGTYVF